ncbi:MAG TPA: DinB family protein [Bryobacteraceae bacterium]|nr:DinB family protein [Bryobacteraceae bacterium]
MRISTSPEIPSHLTVLFCSVMRSAPVGVAVCVFAMCAALAPAAMMTDLERQRLVAHLEMTGSWLGDEISGLSLAQLQFRPAPGSWSILEVLNHLVVSEPIYWRNFQDAMNAPPVNRGPSGSDDSVLWYGIDRTNRQKVAVGEDATGKLKEVKTGLAAFRKLRAEMLHYARTTKEDLRAHFVERERSDAYQWFLLISTHSQRHILQIREIKANLSFPR